MCQWMAMELLWTTLLWWLSAYIQLATLIKDAIVSKLIAFSRASGAFYHIPQRPDCHFWGWIKVPQVTVVRLRVWPTSVLSPQYT